MTLHLHIFYACICCGFSYYTTEIKFTVFILLFKAYLRFPPYTDTIPKINISSSQFTHNPKSSRKAALSAYLKSRMAVPAPGFENTH